MDGKVAERFLAPEELFGQRRSLVGQVVLVRVQHDFSVEAILAQCFGRLGSAQSAADDDEGFRVSHYRSYLFATCWRTSSSSDTRTSAAASRAFAFGARPPSSSGSVGNPSALAVRMARLSKCGRTHGQTSWTSRKNMSAPVSPIPLNFFSIRFAASTSSAPRRGISRRSPEYSSTTR